MTDSWAQSARMRELVEDYRDALDSLTGANAEIDMLRHCVEQVTGETVENVIKRVIRLDNELMNSQDVAKVQPLSPGSAAIDTSGRAGRSAARPPAAFSTNNEATDDLTQTQLEAIADFFDRDDEAL